jgi:hypothetical protein
LPGSAARFHQMMSDPGFLAFVKVQPGSFHLAVIIGRALMLPKMFSPRSDMEGFLENARVFHSLLEREAVAAAAPEAGEGRCGSGQVDVAMRVGGKRKRNVVLRAAFHVERSPVAAELADG